MDRYSNINEIFIVERHRKYVDSFHLAYIASRQSVVIMSRKDICRLGSVRFFRVRQKLFAISKLQNGDIIGTYISGWPGNGGEAKWYWSMVERSEGHAL